MKIEGLKISAENRDKSDENAITRFTPEGAGSFRHIRASIGSDKSGYIELIEGDEKPGIDGTEQVSFVKANPEIIERLARAMASIHFHLFEAEDFHTDVDKSFIERGFQIGTVDDGDHVWVTQTNLGSMITISKTENGGLPSHGEENVWLRYYDAHGSSIKVKEIKANEAFRLIDTDGLRGIAKRGADIEIESIHLSGYTIH